MRVIGYAYPWDVLTDGFVDRARELGVDAVAVALSYHSTRAATPWSTQRTTVHAPTSALYRPVRDSVWGTLRPAAAHWLAERDSGAEAVRVLTEAGIPALGWIVFAHNSLIGSANPQATVINCLGEHYPWALCASNPEVVRYCATLADEATRELDLSGFVLESVGQMGVLHQCQHEKTDGAWSPAVARLLSICCCDDCASRWSVDPDQVRTVLRESVFRLIREDRDIDAMPGDLLPDGLAEQILQGRLAAADELLDAVLERLPEGRVALHASPDVWATGALPGLPPRAADRVDTVVAPCWAPGDASIELVSAARAGLPSGVSVGAYVTAVAATRRPELPQDIGRLAASGANELHLYHLGLAGPARWSDMQGAAAAAVNYEEEAQ